MNDLVSNPVPPIAYAAPASSLSAADAADLARLRAEERQRKDAQIADLNARLTAVEDQVIEWQDAAADAETGKTPGAPFGKGSGAKPGTPPAKTVAAPPAANEPPLRAKPRWI